MRISTGLGVAIALLLGNTSFSQQLKLGNNPSTVQKSAVLELNSANQGLLLARITDTAGINTLAPPDGMVIFFTPTKQLLVRSNGSWQFLTGGSVISSLNGLTAATQTFATGIAGTTFNIVSAGSTHTFNIPDASATARGEVTTAAQTIAGAKTFSSAPLFSSLTAGSVPFIGTGGLLSQTNTNLFWDATNNRLGIGTAAPATALHVVATTNPLTLTGVQTGTNTTADSLLTITSGLIRKLPLSTFVTAGSFWALGGNTVTTVKNFGTIDNNDLPFITNNTEKMRISSAGNVGIGTTTFDGTAPEKLLVNAGTTTSFNAIVARGALNNYFQLNINNQNSGANASSDVVVTADNGTESVNFVDLGINSSGFNTSSIIGGINNAYLYSTGNDFVIGNATSGKNVLFFTGGTASTNEAMRIGSTGKVGIATTTPAAQLDVASNFKLGATGTAQKNEISFAITVSAGTTVPAGAASTTLSSLFAGSYNAGSIDVTVTIPSTSLPTTTRASVSVSLDQDLPANVSIASARVATTGTVKVRFLNASTTAQTIPANYNLYITIHEF